MTDRRMLAAIMAGGCIGALARTGLARLWPVTTGHWPWPTFLVNMAGSALLGYGVTRLQERLPLSAYRRPFLATGICGALTTFATLQLELLRMLQAGLAWAALAYAAASLAGGLAAVWLATAFARRVRSLR
jgi:CrcB protein